MTKFKIDLLMEKYLVTEAETMLFEPTKEGAMALGAELKNGVEVPLFNYSIGSIGKPDTLYVTCALQSRDKWPNGIFENSTYFKMTIEYDGNMEVFSANLSEKSKNPMFAYQRIPVKFRKTKAKNAADAIAKINKFIAQIKEYYDSIGTPLDESNSMKIAPILKSIKESPKDRLVPYILKYTYVDFNAKKRAEGTISWDEKRDGIPTEQSLKKYREGFNKSMEKGGANQHLASGSSPMGTVTAIDQRTGKVVAKYIPPPFETIGESATPDIQQALDNYVEKLNQTAQEDDKRQGYTLPSSVFELSPGKRWTKIVTTTMGGKGQKSVFAFVDPTNGDIYKPAGWNAPAKGKRGNINDPKPPLRGGDLYRYN